MEAGDCDIALRKDTKYKITYVPCKNMNACVYKDWKMTHRNEHSCALR